MFTEAKLQPRPKLKKRLIAIDKCFEAEIAKTWYGCSSKGPSFAVFAKKFCTFMNNCKFFTSQYSINTTFLWSKKLKNLPKQNLCNA